MHSVSSSDATTAWCCWTITVSLLIIVLASAIGGCSFGSPSGWFDWEYHFLSFIFILHSASFGCAFACLCALRSIAEMYAESSSIPLNTLVRACKSLTFLFSFASSHLVVGLDLGLLDGPLGSQLRISVFNGTCRVFSVVDWVFGTGTASACCCGDYNI